MKTVVDAHQVGHACVAWRAVDGLGRALLQHAAGVHHDQPVGEPARLVEVVRDEHDRNRQLAAQVGEQPVQALPVHLVDGRKRLVEQQQARRARQRTRHRHALPLPARKRAGPARLLVARQPHMLEPVTRPGQTLDAGQVQQRQRDVVERAQVRHQRVVLEHEADVAALRRHEDAPRGVAPELAAHFNAAALGPHQAGQNAQHRGLAGARRADQSEQLAGFAAEDATQRHRPRLLDLDDQRRAIAGGRVHRRTASRAEAKNDTATAPSDSSSSRAAMRSAPARSKPCTRS